jgi:Tfp pilus assembly protein PilO
MIHANSIKVKSIDYTCNPQNDEFVKFGKDVYLVYDVNMELISNYVNLGKFIQDVYQYPYYIKINSLTVEPYAKDKRILISTLSLRLYAHTAPDEQEEDTTPLTSATTALPQ